MTEEIIVNGFDVSECYADNKMMKDGLYCFWEGGNCEDNEYCYYKECKRLEQENEELKSLNKKICEDCSKEIKVYWNALEEIKHGIMHIPPFDKQSAQMIEALLKLINEVLNDKEL